VHYQDPGAGYLAGDGGKSMGFRSLMYSTYLVQAGERQGPKNDSMGSRQAH